MFGLSPFELAVIGVIAVVLFGSNLPDVARRAGTTYAEFRRNMNDVQRQFREATTEVKGTFDVSLDDSADLDVDEDRDDAPSAPKFTPPS